MITIVGSEYSTAHNFIASVLSSLPKISNNLFATFLLPRLLRTKLVTNGTRWKFLLTLKIRYLADNESFSFVIKYESPSATELNFLKAKDIQIAVDGKEKKRKGLSCWSFAKVQGK